MKKIIVWLIVIFVFLNKVNMTFSEGNYCDGFRKGFISGWCMNDINCITPIVPVCGIPRVNFNTYEGGFEDGFILGKKERKNL